MAGKGYSAQTLPLIFDFVNLANPGSEKVSRDETGQETIQYLKNVRKIAYRISGTHPSSLGLHPAVYFYSSTGRYQPTSFLAAVGFLQDLEKKDSFKLFTEHRRTFEDFLLDHKDFANQMVRKLGSGLRGFNRLKDLYHLILERLLTTEKELEILAALEKDSNFSFLKVEGAEPDPGETGKDFNRATKSAAFLRDALENPLRCRICRGLIHVNSISVDHGERKQDGGIGALDNAQLTHPYCNTTFKN